MKRRVGWLTEEMKKFVSERKREDWKHEREGRVESRFVIFDADHNTEKDTNTTKSSEFERQLTEEEIVQLLIEVFAGGIDTVSIYPICYRRRLRPSNSSRLLEMLYL